MTFFCTPSSSSMVKILQFKILITFFYIFSASKLTPCLVLGKFEEKCQGKKIKRKWKKMKRGKKTIDLKLISSCLKKKVNKLYLNVSNSFHLFSSSFLNIFFSFTDFCLNLFLWMKTKFSGAVIQTCNIFTAAQRETVEFNTSRNIFSKL